MIAAFWGRILKTRRKASTLREIAATWVTTQGIYGGSLSKTGTLLETNASGKVTFKGGLRARKLLTMEVEEDSSSTWEPSVVSIWEPATSGKLMSQSPQITTNRRENWYFGIRQETRGGNFRGCLEYRSGWVQ